ncbi:MAG: hypothetical protein NTZ65_01160 [Candidatus Berkelbacteria bacterium]|nr:hypothetical protein [Candidatus Berkelbacteria bacterium]
MNKKLIILIVVSLVLAGLNVWSWNLTQKNDLQLAWVAFGLVWLNIVFGWVTNHRQPTLSYIFFSTGLIINALVLINYFWILQRGNLL